VTDDGRLGVLLALAGLAAGSALRGGSRGVARSGLSAWRRTPEEWPEIGQQIEIAEGAMHLLERDEYTLPALSGVVNGVQDGSDGFVQMISADPRKIPKATLQFNRGEGMEDGAVEVHAPFTWRPLRGSRGIARSSRPSRPVFQIETSDGCGEVVSGDRIDVSEFGSRKSMLTWKTPDGNHTILAETGVDTGSLTGWKFLESGRSTPEITLRGPFRIRLSNHLEDDGFRAGGWGDQVFEWAVIHPLWIKVNNWRGAARSPSYLILNRGDRGARWSGDADVARGVRFELAP